MRRVPLIPLLTALALLCSARLDPLIAAEFKAGAARIDITPPIGTPRGGAYATIPSIGILDPLHATAIVIEQGGESVVFVSLDVAYTPRPVVEAARRLIAGQTGIPADRVMISATHTHSGPVLVRDSLMDDVTGGKHPLVVDYTAKLPHLIAAPSTMPKGSSSPPRIRRPLVAKSISVSTGASSSKTAPIRGRGRG